MTGGGGGLPGSATDSRKYNTYCNYVLFIIYPCISLHPHSKSVVYIDLTTHWALSTDLIHSYINPSRLWPDYPQFRMRPFHKGLLDISWINIFLYWNQSVHIYNKVKISSIPFFLIYWSSCIIAFGALEHSFDLLWNTAEEFMSLLPPANAGR